MNETIIPSFNVNPSESLAIEVPLASEVPLIESLTQEGFNMPTYGGATYEVASDIILEFTDNEVILMIADVLNKLPKISTLPMGNMIYALDSKITEMMNYEIDLPSVVNSNPVIKDFLTMVNGCVICFANTIREVSFPIKIVFVEETKQKSPYNKSTVRGNMFKGIPSISVFSRGAINSVINQFYKGHISDVVDSYSHLLKVIGYKDVEMAMSVTDIEVSDISPEMASSSLSNVEIAQMIVSKEINKNDFVAMKLASKRSTAIVMLVQAMKRD